jgi:membrane-bound lytic murein transglycosylase MltF
MPRIDPATREAIERGAAEAGIDPSLALAIAERESDFNPQARSSKTIRGLFQMRGVDRARLGVGDSDDPVAQTKAWGAFFREVQKEMAGQLGRDPSRRGRLPRASFRRRARRPHDEDGPEHPGR